MCGDGGSVVDASPCGISTPSLSDLISTRRDHRLNVFRSLTPLPGVNMLFTMRAAVVEADGTNSQADAEAVAWAEGRSRGRRR